MHVCSLILHVRAAMTISRYPLAEVLNDASNRLQFSEPRLSLNLTSSYQRFLYDDCTKLGCQIPCRHPAFATSWSPC